MTSKPGSSTPLYDGYGRNQGELVRIWLAPINLERCSDPLLRRCKEWASSYGMGIHLHPLETPCQKLYAQRRFNKTAVAHLNDIGFLGPELTLGHGVWITERDIEIMRQTNVSVCHNASSNLRLASGIAPVAQLIERGVPVALGIDEAGLNDDRDMLQEMRLVKHLHRVPGLDRTQPTAVQVFRMATENGAHATGFGQQIGSLEPGKRADLVLLDDRRITEPYLDSEVPVIDAVIHRAMSTDVDTVIIAGEVVLKDRRFTKVDKPAVLQELAESLRVPLEPTARARRRLSNALFPHVLRFYDDWQLEPGEPFYRMNSRN